MIKLFINIKEVKLKIFNIESIKKDYKKIIVSWAFKESFNEEEGQYKDKFLNSVSGNDDILWFLIYMDKELPSRVGKNIVLVYKEKKFIKKNYFFLRYTLKTLKLKNFLSTIKKLNLLSATSVQIKEILKKIFSDINIKNVLIVYEGQPFQKK